MVLKAGQAKLKERNTNKKSRFVENDKPAFFFREHRLPHNLDIDGVWQLDIVKFALPLDKISFHPILSAEGKYTNFFLSEQAASQPLSCKTFSVCATSFFF